MKIVQFPYRVMYSVVKYGRCSEDTLYVGIEDLVEYIRRISLGSPTWVHYGNLSSITFETKEGSYMDLTTNAVCVSEVERLFREVKKAA